MNLKRCMLLHKGKANNVYSTCQPNILELESSDRISAGNGEKKDEINGKGMVNNFVSIKCFEVLQKNQIITHYISMGNNSSSKFVVKLDMIPLEVINRRKTAGSFCKRYGCKEGIDIIPSGVEFCLKDDNLGDPFISDFAIISLGIATKEEIEYMRKITIEVSDILSDFFDKVGIQLIDFKIEFGKDAEGNIVLGDEISPDTCRLIDKATGKKLDKDLFRNNLGNVEEAYNEVMSRL